MTRQTLEPHQELRFETRRSTGDDDTDHTQGKNILRVIKGSCEVFGVGLVNSTFRLAHGTSYGVYTWFGCEIDIDDQFCTGIYTSEDTPMGEIAQIHHNLQLMRSNPSLSTPRVAIVGAANSGKTTLARIMTAYAVRNGGHPILVNLDVTKNELAIPGTIAAASFENELDLFGEVGELSMRSPSPLVYFTGCDTVLGDITRLKDQVKHLGSAIERRLEKDEKSKKTGTIIDTFTYSSSDASYKVLLACLVTLQANVVIVVGEDRLFAQMKRDLTAKSPDSIVIKVGRSGGVTERDLNTRKRLASERLRWYFEGPRLQLSPCRQDVKLGDELTIFIIKAKTISDASIRPIGMEAATEDVFVPRVTTLDASLLNVVLAIIMCQDENDILTSNVAGFVHIVDMSLEAGTLTLLTPCPGPLPSKYLLQGSLKWFEIQ